MEKFTIDTECIKKNSFTATINGFSGKLGVEAYLSSSDIERSYFSIVISDGVYEQLSFKVTINKDISELELSHTIKDEYLSIAVDGGDIVVQVKNQSDEPIVVLDIFNNNNEIIAECGYVTHEDIKDDFEDEIDF